MECFTLDAAFSAFEDDIKGSIKSGKLAEITVLEKDLVEVPPQMRSKTSSCV